MSVISVGYINSFSRKRSLLYYFDSIVKFADAAAAKAAVETMNNVPSGPGQPGMKVRFDRK